MKDEYNDIVKAEAEGLATPEEKAELQADPAKWQAALKCMINGICLQGNLKKDDVASGALDVEDYKIWKRKAMTCKSGLERRLTELKLTQPLSAGERPIVGKLLRELKEQLLEIKADIAELRDLITGAEDERG